LRGFLTVDRGLGVPINSGGLAGEKPGARIGSADAIRKRLILEVELESFAEVLQCASTLSP
jgi:hypothetical protein